MLDFVIVAFAIFILIKQMNRLKRKEATGEEVVAAPPREQVLLEEIRDLLKEQRN